MSRIIRSSLSVLVLISLLYSTTIVAAKEKVTDGSFVCPDHQEGKIMLKANTDILKAFARRKKRKNFGFFNKKNKAKVISARDLESDDYNKELHKYLKKKYKKLRTPKVKKSFAMKVKANGLMTRNLNKVKLARRNKIRALRKKYGIERIYKIEVKEKSCKSFMELIKKLDSDPLIEYAEFIPERKLNLSFDDPFLIKDGEGLTTSKLWGINRIKANQAWDISTGEGVVVAINDTGVDYNHPDIWDNVWVNPNIIEDRNTDGKVNLDDVDLNSNKKIDKDEIVPYMFGYDFADDDSDPMDENSHGTHVAGTVAAVGNNNLGVVGVAPGAKILALKGFETQGGGGGGLYESIDYAVQLLEEGVLENIVVNNSWGYSSSIYDGGYYSQAEQDLFDYAYKAGVINVFAAGNDGSDTLNWGPSFYQSLISVGNSNISDKRSPGFFVGGGSNFGNLVDVVAPGTDIISTVPGNAYASYTGTSMASPHVAGLVALILSQNPNYGIEDIRTILKTSSDDTYFPDFETGLVDALKSMQADDSLPHALLYAEPNPFKKDINTLYGVAYDKQDFSHYTLEYSLGFHYNEKSENASWQEFYRSEKTIGSSPEILLDNLEDYNLPQEALTIKLTVYDQAGNSASDLTSFRGYNLKSANQSSDREPIDISFSTSYIYRYGEIMENESFDVRFSMILDSDTEEDKTIDFNLDYEVGDAIYLVDDTGPCTINLGILHCEYRNQVFRGKYDNRQIIIKLFAEKGLAPGEIIRNYRMENLSVDLSPLSSSYIDINNDNNQHESLHVFDIYGGPDEKYKRADLAISYMKLIDEKESYAQGDFIHLNYGLVNFSDPGYRGLETSAEFSFEISEFLDLESSSIPCSEIDNRVVCKLEKVVPRTSNFKLTDIVLKPSSSIEFENGQIASIANAKLVLKTDDDLLIDPKLINNDSRGYRLYYDDEDRDYDFKVKLKSDIPPSPPPPPPPPPPPVDINGNFADMALDLEPVIAIDSGLEFSPIKAGENIAVIVSAENKSSLREGKTAYGVSFSAPISSQLEYIQNPHSDACSLSEDASQVSCYWPYISAASKRVETLIFSPQAFNGTPIYSFGSGSSLEILNDKAGLEVKDPDLSNNTHTEHYWLIQD